MLMCIIGVVVIAICIALAWYITLVDKYDKISFKESLDLVDLPIITFYNNGKKFHFLLDTGANNSLINKSVVPELEYHKLEGKKELMGIDGIKKEVPMIVVPLKYRKAEYVEMFEVVDLSTTFNSIKQVSGITVHGIVGNTFFTEYKYILDFKELVAYSKKRL